MAGQSVGFVTREQSTAEILEELVSQALAVLAAPGRRSRDPPVVSAQPLLGSRDAPE
jgi:hypothetical protein